MKFDSSKSEPMFSLLPSDTEMGALIRNYNWASTSIGTADKWPQSLRISLGNVLNSGFPMFLFWGNDLTCFYNDAFRPSLGVEGKHPAIGKNGKEVWAETWEFIGPLIDGVMKMGKPAWFENQLVPFYRNGKIEEIYWTFSYSLVFNDDGLPGGVLVTCMETTEAVLGRKKIEANAHRFLNLVKKVPVAAAVAEGKDMVITLANESMLKMWERDSAVLGKPLLQILPELAGQPFPKQLSDVFTTGITYSEQSAFVQFNKEGNIDERYVDYCYQALHDNEGEVEAVLITCTNVTEKVLAQRVAERREQNLRNIISQAPVAMCLLKEPDYVVEIANERMYELWGRGAEDLLHKPIFEGLPEAANRGLEELLLQVYTTGETYSGNEQAITVPRNGKPVTVYVNFVYEAFREDDGSISGIMAVAIDVSVQVLARHKIEEAEERARLAIESAELGTFEVNLQDSRMVASGRMESIFDIKNDSDRYPYINAIHPDDRPTRDAAHRRAEENGLLEYEARIIRKDGSLLWIRVKGKMYYSQTNTPNRLIGVVQDISAQKAFEAELTKLVRERTIELEKSNLELKRSNANLEEFAHAASHDLKEPIRKIYFFITQLRTKLAERLAESEKETFTRIENASQRMGALVDDLLLYSHFSSAPLAKELVDLDEKVKRVLEDLELEILEKGANINVGSLPVINGYSRQLQQLFQNLISNAIKYHKPGIAPFINISYSKVTGNEMGPISNSERADYYALFEVRDNGIGFEQSEAERIFQMFQRLHGNAEYCGTGVGLSIAKKVVENHKGKIIAESEPNKGTTFKVYLPVL